MTNKTKQLKQNENLIQDTVCKREITVNQPLVKKEAIDKLFREQFCDCVRAVCDLIFPHCLKSAGHDTGSQAFITLGQNALNKNHEFAE